MSAVTTADVKARAKKYCLEREPCEYHLRQSKSILDIERMMELKTNFEKQKLGK